MSFWDWADRHTVLIVVLAILLAPSITIRCRKEDK
jgi:hypothetical protein